MKTFLQTTTSLLAPALLLTACGGQQKDAAQEKPLNIIHIMTDDHSFQTISAYGHALGQLAPTPNLDRLAAEGMLFRQAFVENSLSTPSRACLMTGLYSHQNGQRQLGAGIDTTKTFFSEILQQHGYQTGVVGKWHMQCEPKGFDYYAVFNDQGEYYNPVIKTKETNGEYVQEKGYATILTTDHAIEFLDHRDPSKPFCLLVHHKAPHRNWMPETKYLDLYDDVEFPVPETFFDDYATRCDAASTQEMSIDKDMTLVYDLKMEGLKDLEPYKHEAWLGDLEWGLKRMNPEEREAWDKAYAKRTEDFQKKKPTGKDLVRWKYQAYLRDYLRCIKTVDDEDACAASALRPHMVHHIRIGCTLTLLSGRHGQHPVALLHNSEVFILVHYPDFPLSAVTPCAHAVQGQRIARPQRGVVRRLGLAVHAYLPVGQVGLHLSAALFRKECNEIFQQPRLALHTECPVGLHAPPHCIFSSLGHIYSIVLSLQ